MGRKFQLGKPELADELKKKEAQATRARDIQRLMAVRMGMSGEFTLEQIGKAVGRARSRIGEWMKVVRERGLDALLAMHQGRGKAPRLPPKARKELRDGLRRGRWKTIRETGAWLEQRHRIKMKPGGVRYWLKKAGAILRVPRRVHALKNAAQAEEFKGHAGAAAARAAGARGAARARVGER